MMEGGLDQSEGLNIPLVKVIASAMSLWSKLDQWEPGLRFWLGFLGKRRYPFMGAAEGWD